MNYLDKHDELPFSNIELQTAEKILEKFGSKRFASDDYYLNVVYKKTYDGKKDDISFRKLKHLECTFDDAIFDGTDGTSSLLLDCSLKGCTIKNAGFNMSDFTSTKFGQNTVIINSGFTESNFIKTTFQNVELEGCSFQNSNFEDAKISQCNFHCCNFENANFKRTRFEDVDLTTVSIDFAEFNQVFIRNTTFSYWGILWSFGGLQAVQKYADDVKFGLPNSDTYVSGKDFLNQLEQIEAHFYFKKDYFSLANINIYLGNQQKAFLYIMDGLAYNLQIKNFRMIKYLCKLASKNYFFTKKQLQQLYYALQSNKLLKNMASYEYAVYLNEMEQLKKLLIDNPFGQPQIIIKISTNIGENEYDILIKLLEYINKTVSKTAPQSSHYLTLRHNSPFFIELFDSDNLSNLYSLLISLVTGFWGQIPQISALLTTMSYIKKIQSGNFGTAKKLREQEIQLKKEELKTQQITNDLLLLEKEKQTEELQFQKLNNELLELEIEKAKKDLTQMQQSDGSFISIPISEDVKLKILNISYSIHSEDIIPSELRENSISNNMST